MRHAFEPHPALRAEHLEAEARAGRGHRAEIAGHAVLHAEQHRRRVVGVDRHDAPEALAEDGVDRAAEIDHAVDRVHAHRRQPAARRLLALRAPRVRLQHQRVRKRHRRFDVQDGAEVAERICSRSFVISGWKRRL